MRGRARLLVVAVVVLVVVVVGNLTAYAHNREVDLSAADSFTLSAETVALLHQVRHPLTITAFLTATGPEAHDASYLLARYREVNREVTWSVVDPDTNPGEARRFGITSYSTVVLGYQGRQVDAAAVEESDLSTAILRLLRGKTQEVCILTGNGEPGLDDTGPDGLSDVAALLRQNAYSATSVDLTVGNTAVPAGCAAVLEMGPQQALAPTEVTSLQTYLAAGGRLMMLTSSLSSTDPNPILQPYGIGFEGGLVLDPARSEGVDWSNVIVQQLPSASPVDQGVTSLQFPAPSGLVVTGSSGGRTVDALGVTSGQSYVDPNPSGGSVSFASGDIPGPVVVAAASDDSHVVSSGPGPAPGVPGARVVRTRLFVTGCDTWMTNGFLDNLGNRRFFVNAVNWLAGQDNLVLSTSQPPGSRPLPLTPGLQAELLGVTVGAVPAVIVSGVLGRVAWTRRRGRRVRRR